MRLIHCKKCGAALVTDDALVERMNETIHELNEKARKSKHGGIAKSYLAEAASVTKMMKGIIHNTTQLEYRRTTVQAELSEIIAYINKHDLIPRDVLNELRKTARMKAMERDAENQKEIDRIYCTYNSLYSPVNKTKADPTANKAIRKTK
mgnify:CR=1 FL=1